MLHILQTQIQAKLEESPNTILLQYVYLEMFVRPPTQTPPYLITAYPRCGYALAVHDSDCVSYHLPSMLSVYGLAQESRSFFMK